MNTKPVLEAEEEGVEEDVAWLSSRFEENVGWVSGGIPADISWADNVLVIVCGAEKVVLVVWEDTANDVTGDDIDPGTSGIVEIFGTNDTLVAPPVNVWIPELIRFAVKVLR